MTTTTTPAHTSPSDGRHHRSATRRLVTTELRLMLRDPMTLTFVLVFPVLCMLIIGGSFGTSPDEVFPVNRHIGTSRRTSRSSSAPPG